ncbi:MAG: LamG domain-containing protein, partial [Caldilineaceae bacterium]
MPRILVRVPWFVPFAAVVGAMLLLLAPRAAAAQTNIFVDDSVPDGLVAHFTFDEGSGAVTRDWPNPALEATLAGNATMAGAGPLLQVPNASALTLDGSGDFAGIADNAAAAPLNALTNTLTLAAWVLRTSTGTVDSLYTNGTLNPNAWHVDVLTDNRIAFRIGTTNPALVWPSSLASSAILAQTNVWHHVALTLAGDELRIYLDGALDSVTSAVSIRPPQSGPKFVGTQNGAQAFWPGRIDDLRLYNRALSASEIQRLAQGKGCVTDGLAWATAFRDLQCALAAPESGATVRVAAGAYRPGLNVANTFHITTSLTLLGGFLGNGAILPQTPDDRPPFNPNAPLTVLTGDLLGNDVASGFLFYEDNAELVV